MVGLRALRLDELKTMTGMVRVRRSPFTRLKTSNPVTLGSFKSKMMTLGRLVEFRPECRLVQKMNSKASAPSGMICKRAASPALSNVWTKKSTSSRLSSTSKISAASSDILILIRVFECEIKYRAVFRPALSPDTPSMTLYNALHNGQADASAFELIRTV